jgi:hypothetical protein
MNQTFQQEDKVILKLQRRNILNLEFSI